MMIALNSRLQSLPLAQTMSRQSLPLAQTARLQSLPLVTDFTVAPTGRVFSSRFSDRFRK